METKNNQTQVDVLLAEIKAIAEGKANKDDYNSKMAELKEAMDNRNKEVDRQIGDVETKFEQRMAKMTDSITNGFKAVHQPAIAPEQKYGKSFGEFLRNVKSKAMEIKDLAEGTGASGGYLVPDQFMAEILKVDLEQSVVRSNGARIINMTSNKLMIPALDMDTNAAGSIYGGVAAYWGSENGTMTETQPTFKRVTLEPKKLYGYCEDPNELEADAIVSMGSLLTQMFGEVLAFEEDYAFLTNATPGRPQGIITAPAYITVSRATSSQVNTTDIINMMARFKGNMSRAKFFVNQSVLPYIYALQDPNGSYIWAPSAAAGSPGTLYGRPIVVTEKLPALGTTGDVLLADMGFYLIGDRAGMSVMTSEHFKFQNDQMAYRVTKRVDGQVWLDSAITPRAGGSTLSPFVGIG
jgi:HK97 family phage major capsid protein